MIELNGEKSRFENMIKKVGTFNDKSSVRDVADRFRILSSFADQIKENMDRLKKRLLADQVKEYFPEDKIKVIFQEGRNLTEIDPKYVYENISTEEFLFVVKIVESKLKEIQPILAIDGKEVVGKAKPSISVKKMTKEEITDLC